MKRSLRDAESGKIPFCAKTLTELREKGYKFVLVNGFTIDKHYDYVDPSVLLLVPVRELPADPDLKGIYEPIDSEMLLQWSAEKNEHPQILIAKRF